MKNRYQKYTNATLLSCLAFTYYSLTMPVCAEQLQEIEVMGDTQNERWKNAEESFLLPYSKQVIGRKTIDEENIPDIAEAVRDISGVSVTENGAFSKNIKIRGLGGTRVTTLVNGVKLSNQGMTHTGSGETGTLEMTNVEQIEVIKGSPSVIYDPGASGGVINIITRRAPEEKGVNFTQNVSYDEGYDKTKYSSILSASTGKYGARVSYTKSKSNDYKISGDKKDKRFLIDRVNFLTDESPGSIAVSDLGFDTREFTVDLNAKIGDDSIIEFRWTDWLGKDMNIIHGQTIREAGIIQYDKMESKGKSLTYRKKKLGELSNITVQYAHSQQKQIIGKGGGGVKLSAKQFNFIADYYHDNFIWKIGGEALFDDAVTQVYAEQKYYGLFVNSEYRINDWTIYAGLRLNRWTTEQRLLDGANKEAAAQLVGISGITPAKTKSSPTMALGVQYAINETNNISLNLNTTYHNPDLMERYSFSSTLGGGLEMEAEEGKHAELSWKYLDDNFAITSSIYYSDFKNYIWTKQHRNLVDKNALLECIRQGDCDPTKGEFDDRERDFFDIYNQYYNSKEVTNLGMEFDLKYSIPQHEVVLSSSFNKIKANDIFVKSAANPIDTTISYRYEVDNSWKPWIKIKGQYVLNKPKVEQYKKFHSYFVANVYFGFKKDDFIVSAGVKNLFDKEYHAAYSGINSLARHYFVNIAYEW